MKAFKDSLIKHAESLGVDLIGFGGRGRFLETPLEENPFSIFPEGETVILLGKRITRGALRGIEEGTNFGDYSLFGSSWLDDNFNSAMCYEMTRYLEDMGYEAVPVFPNPTQAKGMGIPTSEGKIAPNVTPDFSYAAVACGLGEIGYCQEVLTPRFGPRQRWQMIITDAVIEEDPILDMKICTQCKKCAEICPLGAMAGSKKIEICGKVMETAIVDLNLCKKCKNGAFPNRLLKDARPDRLGALCIRTCVDELDDISNAFENPFRKRDAWAIDIYDKSSYVKSDLGGDER